MLLSKLKDNTIYHATMNYFNNTPVYRKIIDTCLIMLMIVTYGVASGKIPLPNSDYTGYGILGVVGILFASLGWAWFHRKEPTHTVKQSYSRSKEVQKHLDYLQVKEDYNFVGHFVMHNGTQGLGGYNFIKYSLTEFSSANGITPDVLAMQELPIVMDMPMVQSLLNNQCHVGKVTTDNTSYRIYNTLRINNYVACPVQDIHKNLIGFLLLGNSNEINHDEDELRKLAAIIKQYNQFQK